jgi:hypothetical protein
VGNAAGMVGLPARANMATFASSAARQSHATLLDQGPMVCGVDFT